MDISTIAPTIEEPKLLKAFSCFDGEQLPLAYTLRKLIIDTAQTLDVPGQLVETTKWNEPAYLTQNPSQGSTVRIGRIRLQNSFDSKAVALHFICTSGLIETFKNHYEGELDFVGDRSIRIAIDKDFPQKQLSHCIGLALTRDMWKN